MEELDTGRNEAQLQGRHTAPNKKKKLVPVEELTREEMEARVHQLEAHNKQLRNLLAKSQGRCGGVPGESAQEGRKAKKPRPFDFTKHSRRHVLLKFAYLGWDYQGYAAQEDTQDTIEARLFPALLKTRLIQSRETSNYHRCGRTDKGVSAFEQVISITLRSNCWMGIGVEGPQKPSEMESGGLQDMTAGRDNCPEINYVQLLNRVLPTEIRMLAWSPAPTSYSARFDCSARTYKYFFPRANLNLEVMCGAAQHLVGYHDFRNFCKMDVANGVVTFQRHIRAISITPLCCDVAGKRDTKKGKVMESDIMEETMREVVRKEIGIGSRNEGTKSTILVDENGTKYEKIRSEAEETENRKNEESIIVSKYECMNHITELSKGLSEDQKMCTPAEHSSAFCIHQQHLEGQNTLPRLNSKGYDMCVATIEGEAFLWHQIRCIMTVLLLVGEGKESPDVVAQLLDVNKHPRKPQYCLASEIPLSLYATSFEGVMWQWDDDELYLTMSQLQHLWTQHAVRASMIRRMLWDLEQKHLETVQVRGKEEAERGKMGEEMRKEEGETKDEKKGQREEEVKELKKEIEKDSDREKEKKIDENNEMKNVPVYMKQKQQQERRGTDGGQQEGTKAPPPPPPPLPPQHQNTCLIPGAKCKVYRPLLSRPTCESLETRVQHYIKRQRLGPEVLQKLTPGAATHSEGGND